MELKQKENRTIKIEIRVTPEEHKHYLSALQEGETLSDFIRKAGRNRANYCLKQRAEAELIDSYRARKSSDPLPDRNPNEPYVREKKPMSIPDSLKACLLKGKAAGKSWMELLNDVQKLGFKKYGVHDIKDIYKQCMAS